MENKMRKEIDIRKIDNKIYESENIDDMENFEYLIEEAAGTNALEFFDIEYNRDSKILSIPDDFDSNKASDIVNCYFAFVNENSEEVDAFAIEIQDQAKEYDEYTRDSRGADDGTFDYAGTFVMSIIEVIKQASLK